jgi:hypothetical protein
MVTEQKKYAVFFANIQEVDDVLVVNEFCFVGKVNDRATAEKLARDIVDDNNIHGAIIPKIIPIQDGMRKAVEIAGKYFRKMATEIADIEERKKKDL